MSTLDSKLEKRRKNPKYVYSVLESRGLFIIGCSPKKLEATVKHESDKRPVGGKASVPFNFFQVDTRYLK